MFPPPITRLLSLWFLLLLSHLPCVLTSSSKNPSSDSDPPKFYRVFNGKDVSVYSDAFLANVDPTWMSQSYHDLNTLDRVEQASGLNLIRDERWIMKPDY